MSEYLGRSFDNALRTTALVLVLVFGIIVLGSFAAGYWVGRSYLVHQEATK